MTKRKQTEKEIKIVSETSKNLVISALDEVLEYLDRLMSIGNLFTKTDLNEMRNRIVEIQDKYGNNKTQEENKDGR